MTWKTTLKDARAKREATSAPSVRVLFTPGATIGASRVVVAPSSELPIGRAVGETGVSLPDDPRVSRHHATLRFVAEGCVVRDESSTGTYLDGARIGEAQLREGSVLRVGDSFLSWRAAAPGDEGAAPVSLRGASPQLGALKKALVMVGKAPASVLVLGETGTGKELAARALHDSSGRSGPFVAVNCAAIPEALAESQLFGHVSGAFTGAKDAAQGVFRAAEGGTLFLDEIGELPMPLQAKLLRAVEERAVVPVGATQPIACDVRIVAATNRDLLDADRFRGDLYARLSEFVLEIPPLRDRREDVLPILAAFLGDTSATLDPDLVAALLHHAYPYNSRDLRKFAMQLKVRGEGHDVWELSMIDVPSPRSEPAPSDPPSEAHARAPSRDEVEALLRTHRGVIADVARATGRSRKQVYRWLEQYGLDLDAYR